MVQLKQYPNPVRLFTQTRNAWFKNFVESLNVPIHIFTNIRDTQLGQLFFAIEIMRQKKIRSGEEPGQPLFEGESIEAFVPLFQIFKSLEEFIGKEEVNLELKDLKTEFLKQELVKTFKKIGKSDDEWFSTLELSKLDELFIASAKILLEFLLPKIDEAITVKEEDEKEEDGEKDIFDRLGSIDQNFSFSIKNLCDPIIVDAIENNTYSIDEENTSIRVIPNGDETIKLSYDDYHSRVNVLYSFVLELLRYFEKGKNYSRSFKYIPHLLTLEMVIMIPSPEKARITLVKNYLREVKQLTKDIPSEFWELISLSYQGFSHVFEPNKMFSRLFKGIERSLKTTARSFWRRMESQLLNSSKKERENAEQLVAVLWSHFRVVQAQAQHLHQQKHQDHDHSNYTYRTMLRLEHIFWQQGGNYLNTDDFLSKYHFWSAYAKIANREIRTPKDSLSMYHEFTDLFEKTRILSNKTKRKTYDIEIRDLKSIVQAAISYGIEGKDGSIYPDLQKYLEKLTGIVHEIEEDIENFPEIQLEEEKKTLESIGEYLKLPIPDAPTGSSQTKKGHRITPKTERRLRN